MKPRLQIARIIYREYARMPEKPMYFKACGGRVEWEGLEKRPLTTGVR
jgi:hypothetical protein